VGVSMRAAAMVLLCVLLSGTGCASPAPAVTPAPATPKHTPGPGLLTYRLQVYVDGGGRVELEPPGRDFPVGTVVTVSAYPAEGSRFSYFIYNKKKSTSPTLRLTMKTDMMVTAVFVREQ
jgi:hypothetical protein